jgi:hypothetical protein
MIYFNIVISLRTDSTTLNGINELLDIYPEKYDNMSQVIRCAIIKLVDEERLQKENENN